MPQTLLDMVREQREATIKPANDLVTLAETEGRDLTEAEFAVVVETKTATDDIDKRLAELTDLAARNALAQVEQGVVRRNIRVGNEPQTYSERGEHSHIRDIMNARLKNDPQAWDRLRRHGGEVLVEMRDLTRIDGAGGEFVPPLWLVDMYGDFPRASRVIADLCTQIPLPGGTDSINLPRITTGPAVAIQTADNAAVNETDLVSATVTAPVRTIAGQQDLAVQLIDQSPLGGGMDALIYGQLAADYQRALGVQIWNGSGAAGQVTGVLVQASTNSVAYTDGTPTVPELYLPLAQAASQVHTNSFVAATAIVMTPRRWNWMMSALDASSRPLVVPNANGPYMAIGQQDKSAAAGPVGSVLGLPVYLDATGPLLLGAGTEDAILIAKWDDAVLMEGSVNTAVHPGVGSGTLTVRFQLYRYVAFTAGRRPQSFSKITGTGLIAPAGF